MQEREYQQIVAANVYEAFLPARPLADIIVYINDPNYIQGIPDLSVFYRPTGRWGMLEVKMSADAKVRPNQQFYIDTWGTSIFTSFIYPENEAEVIRALQRSLAG